MDVFPALAYLSGLPVADDLPGDLELEIFTQDRLAEQPPDYVRTYASIHPKTVAATADNGPSAVVPSGASDQANQDNIKALQGLGYVGESFEYADAETQAFDFWASDVELITQHLVGEFSFHLLKEDEISAAAVLTEAGARNEVLPGKILLRTQRSLETIRNMIGGRAVPESAFGFIRSAQSEDKIK